MYLPIDNPNRLTLTRTIHQILSRMFCDSHRVVVERELNQGFSGGRILQVRAINQLGKKELPVVVKFAATSQIQKEWAAYREHIHNRLPSAPSVPQAPEIIPQAGLGGICYELVGHGIFDLMNLADYLRGDNISAEQMHRTVNHLQRMMHVIWDWSQEQHAFRPDTGYDSLLPVHLLVEHDTSVATQRLRLVTPYEGSILAGNNLDQAGGPINVGDTVRIRGFVVHKANWATHTVTLRRPEVYFNECDYFIRCRSGHDDRIASYYQKEVGPEMCGRVLETRESRLQDEVRRAFGDDFDVSAPFIELPAPYEEHRLVNPLTVYEQVLTTTRPVRVSSIHGDLNLDNILIERETGKVHLIDFAETRHDHVLHDLLRLEAETICKLLSKVVSTRNLCPITTLLTLYQALHEELLEDSSVSHQPIAPELSEVWIMLSFVRRTAREYLFDPNDVGEYYQGLFLYMLGYLKYKNLSRVPEAPMPKRLAFWCAAIAYTYLQGHGERLNLNPKVSLNDATHTTATALYV